MSWWITSCGRTGTAWLARQLRVRHEPPSGELPMVSPAHVYRYVVEGWRPPAGTTKVVIVRNARDQLESSLNRWVTLLGLKRLRGRVDNFKLEVPKYLALFDEWIEYGATVVRYEDIVSSPVYVAALANRLDHPYEHDEQAFEQRINAFDKRITFEEFAKADPGIEDLRQLMQEHYDRWLP